MVKIKHKDYFWTVPVDKRDREESGLNGFIVRAKYKDSAYRTAKRRSGEMNIPPRVNKSQVHKTTAEELDNHIDNAPVVQVDDRYQVIK